MNDDHVQSHPDLAPIPILLIRAAIPETRIHRDLALLDLRHPNAGEDAEVQAESATVLPIAIMVRIVVTGGY